MMYPEDRYEAGPGLPLRIPRPARIPYVRDAGCPKLLGSAPSAAPMPLASTSVS